MQLSSINLIPAEYKIISEQVKAVVKSVDPSGITILFGSRARGDASEESDWDFLVLSNTNDVETLASIMRREIRIKVEMIYDIAVSLLVKNKIVWEDDYAVTNIYNSIEEEGIVL
jgi:predicted nucleotidyltransferase